MMPMGGIPPIEILHKTRHSDKKIAGTYDGSCDYEIYQ